VCTNTILAFLDSRCKKYAKEVERKANMSSSFVMISITGSEERLGYGQGQSWPVPSNMSYTWKQLASF
jgi:hypothetical protein